LHHTVVPYSGRISAARGRFFDALDNVDRVAEEVRVDYVELTRLAADVLTGSQNLADAWRTAKADLSPPVAAFGNSKAGPAVRDSHEAVMEDADVTIGRQVGVLEGDVDRLYRVAFAYEKQEADNQEALFRAGQGGQSLRGVP